MKLLNQGTYTGSAIYIGMLFDIFFEVNIQPFNQNRVFNKVDKFGKGVSGLEVKIHS